MRFYIVESGSNPYEEVFDNSNAYTRKEGGEDIIKSYQNWWLSNLAKGCFCIRVTLYEGEYNSLVMKDSWFASRVKKPPRIINEPKIEANKPAYTKLKSSGYW